jgi:hypothetical protein
MQIVCELGDKVLGTSPRVYMPAVPDGCTDKKENKVFLIYKEFQMGSVAKSYMMKGFLIYMRKCASI